MRICRVSDVRDPNLCIYLNLNSAKVIIGWVINRYDIPIHNLYRLLFERKFEYVFSESAHLSQINQLFLNYLAVLYIHKYLDYFQFPYVT